MPARAASTAARRSLHDQRYCLGCGDRRGPLPATVAELIAAGLQRRRQLPPRRRARRRPRSAPSQDEDPLARWLPQPRAAALAVMALLAFGVVVGSVVSPPADSAGTPPVVIASAASRDDRPATAATDRA